MPNDRELKGGVEATSSVVGIWELLSYSWHFPDGRMLEPWGKAIGRISYDANGNMICRADA